MKIIIFLLPGSKSKKILRMTKKSKLLLIWWQQLDPSTNIMSKKPTWVWLLAPKSKVPILPRLQLKLLFDMTDVWPKRIWWLLLVTSPLQLFISFLQWLQSCLVRYFFLQLQHKVFLFSKIFDQLDKY